MVNYNKALLLAQEVGPFRGLIVSVNEQFTTI
jgi:hypothetical protein